MARIARWLEAALLLGGGALVLLFAVAALQQQLLSRWDRALFAQQAVRSVAAPQPEAAAHALPARLAPAEPAERLEPIVDTSLWSAGRIAAYFATLEGPAGLARERLALLEIPAVDLEVVVLDGTDDWTLNRGVGRIQGTATPGAPGNAGIAGHRDGFFRALAHVQPGDVVRLTAPGRTPLDYQIEWVRVVRPEDVWVLEPTEGPSLTLVTCHPFYFVGHAPEHFIVRASATDPALASERASPEAPRREG